jgi:succinylglutamate desuccinylase
VRLRYLDRDLNRSFGRDAHDSVEDRRARQIEPLLASTAFMMDVHQTSDVSKTPFFIFPYARQSVDFARAVQAEWPIVTFSDPEYSPMGRCCDEYVQGSGGVGITLELGQAGVDPYQEAVGRWAAARAVYAVACALQNLPWPEAQHAAPIYTWCDVVPYPTEPSDFAPEVCNFAPIRQGQTLGEIGGTPMVADRDGIILFPMRPAHLAHLPARPRALYRVLREIDLETWSADKPG